MARMVERAGAPALAVGGAYVLVYLLAVGDIDLAAVAHWGGRAVPVTLERITAMRQPFQFEALALVELGRVVVLLSPGNILVAGLLGALLGANLHGALELRRRPATCSPYARSGGLIGAAPALLAGGACCAPTLLLLLGIPALGAFTAFFGWLIPLSLLLLAAGRLWQRRQGAPAVLGVL